MYGPENRLKLTIQKDGRLGEESTRLLREANFAVERSPRVDFTDDPTFPLRTRFIKNGAIGGDLVTELSDLAIMGLDMVEEADPDIIRLTPLGFARCGLYLGVRDDIPYSSPQDLDGKRIATSYIKRATIFALTNNIDPQIIQRPGGEESLVNEGNAEACIVVSETGDSFIFNRIDKKALLLASEAYLVASPTLRQQRGKQRIVEQFLERVMSVIRARQFTYIVMNAPLSSRSEVIDVLPSSESPTISQLDNSQWLAISSVIPRGDFEDIIEKLQQLGVKDIIELVMKRVIPNRQDRVIMEMMGKIYD